MYWKQLTKTSMMISNWKQPFGLHGLYKTISALLGLKLLFVLLAENLVTPENHLHTQVLVSFALRCYPVYSSHLRINPYNPELFVFKPWRLKGYFKFEIAINVLVSSFCLIWIPMLWVYGQYKCFNSVSVGTVFIVRIWHPETSDSDI